MTDIFGAVGPGERRDGPGRADDRLRLLGILGQSSDQADTVGSNATRPNRPG